MVNLPITYSDEQVTPFGGMSLMKRFIDQTGIREKLSSLDMPSRDQTGVMHPEYLNSKLKTLN